MADLGCQASGQAHTETSLGTLRYVKLSYILVTWSTGTHYPEPLSSYQNLNVSNTLYVYLIPFTGKKLSVSENLDSKNFFAAENVKNTLFGKDTVMTDVIYKYGPISYGKEVEFKGRPVHVDIHVDGQIYIWCLQYDGYEELEGNFGKARIVYTGEEYTGYYIGTVIERTGLVFHVVAV